MILLKQRIRRNAISHCKNLNIFLDLAQGLNQPFANQSMVFDNDEFRHGSECNWRYDECAL